MADQEVDEEETLRKLEAGYQEFLIAAGGAEATQSTRRSYANIMYLSSIEDPEFAKVPGFAEAMWELMLKFINEAP